MFNHMSNLLIPKFNTLDMIQQYMDAQMLPQHILDKINNKLFNSGIRTINNLNTSINDSFYLIKKYSYPITNLLFYNNMLFNTSFYLLITNYHLVKAFYAHINLLFNSSFIYLSMKLYCSIYIIIFMVINFKNMSLFVKY